MAFWNRRKKKQRQAEQVASGDETESESALPERLEAEPSVDEPTATEPPLPPAAREPVPAPRLDPTAPIIDRDGLEPGTLTIDEVVFRPVSLPDLPDPHLDGDRPESFGEPNWDRRTLIEHLRAASIPLVDDLERLLIVSRNADDPHYGFLYSRNRQILPVWFEGATIDSWLMALSHDWETGPQQLYAGRSGGYSSGTAVVDVEPDVAAFIIRNAPDRWKGAEDAPAKQQLLDEALAAAGPRATVDPAVVADLWQQLIEATGAAPNPPATEAQLASFESATGFPVPPELAAMSQVQDGAKGPFGMMEMMTVDQILVEWGGWKQIFDEWPLADLTGNSASVTDEALGIYTTPYWIPLVDERTGNFAALDLAPGPQGTPGQIIYFGAEESDSIRVLATDLADFLRKQLAHVEAEIADKGTYDADNSVPFYMN